MSNLELSAVVFFQLAIILAAVQAVGALARRLGQPQVVGEMIAGVVLGASLFGWLLPDLQASVFPKPSISVLHVLSQIGLVIYMFLVGAEFEMELTGGRIRTAAAVSAAGIAVPFALAAVLAAYLHGDPNIFAPGVSLSVAVLFLGAAMSITAFPVLARIISERRLTGTPMGALVMAAGALDDAAAWCIFAFVLALSGASSTAGWLPMVGGAAYVAVVAVARRAVFVPMAVRADRGHGLSGGMLSALLTVLMLGAWYTDVIGIHSVFGAFVLGVAVPRGVVTRDLQRYLEPAAKNFLVPLFFVVSGLNTKLGLVFTWQLWALTPVILLVACLGKAGGCWLAARLSGESNRDALAVGTLMNARGLMELILLNIALERGIITPVLFASMVIMAVGTTIIATPAFAFVQSRQRLQAAPTETAVPA
jgi:Kef-type K+ transport system membrane component KefB